MKKELDRGGDHILVACVALLHKLHFIHHVTGMINHKGVRLASSILGYTNVVLMLTERGADIAPRTFLGRLHHLCPYDTIENWKLLEYSSYSSSAARCTVEGGFLPRRTSKASIGLSGYRDVQNLSLETAQNPTFGPLAPTYYYTTRFLHVSFFL